MLIGFYGVSFLLLVLALQMARLHGSASKSGYKYNERIWEFWRNALIQVASMLFALGTALYVFDSNVERGRAETERTERSSATTVIGNRAFRMIKAVGQFPFQVKPDGLPDCSDGGATTVYDDECREKIRRSKYELIGDVDDVTPRINELADSLRISEDWFISPYFAKNVPQDIIRYFRTVESKTNDERLSIIAILRKLRESGANAAASDQDIQMLRDLDGIYTEFQKNTIIYFSAYLVIFGEKIDRDYIIESYKSYRDSLQENVWNLQRDDLNEFVSEMGSITREHYFSGQSISSLLRQQVFKRQVPLEEKDLAPRD